MKTVFFIFTLCLFGTNCIPAQTFFDTSLGKTWDGKGTIMGASTEFEMRWSKTLGNQFYTLDFQNQMTTKQGKVVFSATAYYQIENETEIKGTWFDSQGSMYNLTGKVSNNELIVFWGKEGKPVGKTVYSIRDQERIQVDDYSMQNGEEVQFGHALYVMKKV